MTSRVRRSGICRIAVLAALALWSAPAGADAAPPIEARVGNHPAFGRIVFEFDAHVVFGQVREGDHLILHFADGVTIAPPARPPQNVAAITTDAGLVDLRLRAGATTRVYWLGNRLVVDVLDPPAAAPNVAPSAIPASATTLGGEARAGTSPGGTSPGGGPSAVVWSGGALPAGTLPGGASSADASRNEPTDPALRAGTLSPPAARPLPLPPPPAPPPPELARAAAIAPGGESRVPSAALTALSTSPSAAPAPSVSPAGLPSAGTPTGAPLARPPATSPATDARSMESASNPVVPHAALPVPTPAAAPVLSPAPAPATAGGAVAPPAAVAGVPVGPIALVAAKTDTPRQPSALLSLPFPSTVGVAAFRRGGSALVVFDERRPVDLAGLRGDPLFGAATILLLPAATVLRLPLPADRALVLSQTPNAWRVGVIDDAPPLQPIPLHAEGGQLNLATDAAGDVVAVADPETGGTLLVGTQKTAGQGIPTLRETPEFNLLPTWQGVAIAPLADQLAMRAVASGFLLTGGKQGLAMASSSAAMQAQTDAAGMTRRFDLRAGPTEMLLERLGHQVAAAGLAAPLARGPLRLAAAATMISLGLGAEAQAMVQLASTDDPTLGEGADAAGLGAIAALLAGRITEADGIEDPRLTGSDEVTLWRAVRAADLAHGSPRAATGFATAVPLIDVYPAALRRRLLPLAFETMIEGGQTTAAAQQMARQTPGDPNLALADGMLREANGDTDGALAIYARLAAGSDQLIHARAAVRAVELRLTAGRIDASQAADALDLLLYSWRGGRRELALRERVADLRKQAGAWPAALAMLRETEDLFPDDKAAVHARMKAAFAELLNDNALDQLAPLELVALIDENADLLPSGLAGEAMDERLADRLVALDLPKRAAPVLAKLMAMAPSPATRAGFGARLAELRLRENDAPGALAALTGSANPPLAAPLAAPLAERRALITAGAQARIGDMTGAVAGLAALGTAAADLARAAILEHAKNWPDAEKALADYLGKTEPRTGPLDPAQQRIVLRYATAAAQAGDDKTLAQLRDSDGPRMPAGPLGDMFRLLTAEPVHVSADLPRAIRETALARALPKSLDALGTPTATP